MEQSYKYTFTVFTPTHNRAHTLNRVYKSLINQTFNDFEWLIIDDGSTDDTKEIIDSWISEGKLDINYIHQTNQGKHVAYNRGVNEAKGELFLGLDSDDACIPEALERFKFHWDNITEERKNDFTGVTSLCMDQNGNLIGTAFPDQAFDSNPIELDYKYKVKGEKWGFHRTEILKKHPFPTNKNMKFIPESIVWNSIALNYRERYINEKLRIYFTGADDQLSNTSNSIQHASGIYLRLKFKLNNEIKYFKYAPMSFFRSSVSYIRYGFHHRKHIVEQISNLNNSCSRLLWFAAFPIGLMFYFFDKTRILKHNN